MEIHGHTPAALAAVFGLAGLGVDISGYENEYAAYALWGVAALFLLWAAYLNRHILREIRFRSPVYLGNKGAQEPAIPKPEEPNYQAWDHVEEFELWQAACLWAGIEPASGYIDNSQVYAWLRMLKDAIRREELNANFTLDQAIQLKRGHHIVDKRTRVKRKELRAFAEKSAMNPRFLFPENQ